jgi:5'-nucleotidase
MEVPEGACKVPKGFCSKNTGRGEDKLMYRDCDGDNIPDPYCEGGELLRFGYISSANNCKNNWPNGVCIKQDNPEKKDNTKSAPAAGNEITIIHFNDVYQVAGVFSGGVRRGGMSRAAHAINKERLRNPDRTFVVFAGDALSPSVLSDLFEGEQMIDILNTLKLDAASLGNHEFDFGVDTLQKRLQESKFPWLNINLQDPKSGKLLDRTKQRTVREVPFSPRWAKEGEKPKKSRVCLFGASYDVRETMFKDKDRVEYLPIINASKKEAEHLRKDEKCDVVLALTHQFSADDCKLSAALGDSVDLILGGHDHSTEMKTVCGHAPYVKADSDLKTQWVMTLFLSDDGKVESVDGRLISLTDVDPFDLEIHDKIVEWERKGAKEMGKVIGCSKVDLDSVASHARQGEVNSGVFFTDAVKAMHKTDVALINGGTIRGDKIFKKGDLAKVDTTSMHPFGNAIVKIYATGADLRKYFEHTLRCYSDVCGDFLQVSGLKYKFDPKAPVGKRLKSLMHPDGTEVKDDDKFTVALSDYMLANSNMKHNKLYDMVTTNDAVPIVQALNEAVIKAGKECISPKVEGRITKV